MRTGGDWMSNFGDEREKNKGKIVALIEITKDGKARILEGKSLSDFLRLWDTLIGLLILYGGVGGKEEGIQWKELKSVRIERKKK